MNIIYLYRYPVLGKNETENQNQPVEMGSVFSSRKAQIYSDQIQAMAEKRPGNQETSNDLNFRVLTLGNWGRVKRVKWGVGVG